MITGGNEMEQRQSKASPFAGCKIDIIIGDGR